MKFIAQTYSDEDENTVLSITSLGLKASATLDTKCENPPREYATFADALKHSSADEILLDGVPYDPEKTKSLAEARAMAQIKLSGFNSLAEAVVSLLPKKKKK